MPRMAPSLVYDRLEARFAWTPDTGAPAFARKGLDLECRKGSKMPGPSRSTKPIVDPPLAYQNLDFLDSDAARPLRILAEYIQPYHVFQRERVRDTVVFMGSSRIGPDGPLGRYYREARELARLLTEWSQSLPSPAHRLLVCSGGGPGIMEAANRGAVDAGGRSIALNIGLPHEQRPNPYVTESLCFQFHYFFMRKLWFAHLARGIVVFPGGFGTCDELFEILTLSQTRKLGRSMAVLLYGPEYWKEVLNVPALVRHGTISQADVDLFRFVDSPRDALAVLKEAIEAGEEAEAVVHPETETPAVARSVTPRRTAPVDRKRGQP